MATGFGFCPNCGTALTSAGQKFCASCGAVLLAVAAPAAVPAPVVAPQVAASPPPPPPWAVPPSAAAPMVPPAYSMPAPVAAAPAKTGISPNMLVIGGVLIAAIVGGAFFVMNNNSKSSGPGGNTVRSSGSVAPANSGGNNGAYPGSMVFSPSTVTCGQTYMTTIRLPSSVSSTDEITLQDNGTTVGTHTVVDAGMTQQPDGTWYGSDTGPIDCSMSAGIHTERLVDPSGDVLAEGSFTFVESASPSPGPLSEGTVTVEPSSFSCSGAEVDVTVTIQLPGSIPGSTQLTSEIDGSAETTSSVESGFAKQSDGTWLSTATISSSDLCSELGAGQHRIGAMDANGNVVAEGTFTVNP